MIMTISQKLEQLFSQFISSGKGRLVVTSKLPSRTQRLLEELERSSSDNFTVIQWKNETRPVRHELLDFVKGATGILCMLTDKIDLELLEAAGPQLRVVSTMSVGYDHIDTVVVKEKGVLIGNTPGVLTDATSDIAALLVLAAARRAKEGNDAVVNAKWGTWDPNWLLGMEFTGKTLGIVGLGRIGVATAARLIPFGFSKILYSGSKPHPEDEQLLINIGNSVNNLNKAYGNSQPQFECNFLSTSSLFAESDVVVLCCSLNQHTYHLVNKSNISLFKKGSVLVNPARGPIIDSEALLDGLNSGTIFAAGLDVTHPEPIDPTHPLALHPRCFIMPHLGSATTQTREAMSNLALENLLCGQLGIELTHSV